MALWVIRLLVLPSSPVAVPVLLTFEHNSETVVIMYVAQVSCTIVLEFKSSIDLSTYSILIVATDSRVLEYSVLYCLYKQSTGSDRMQIERDSGHSFPWLGAFLLLGYV